MVIGDRSQLAHVDTQEAKAALQTDTLEAVADRGYASAAKKSWRAIGQASPVTALPKPMTSGIEAKGRFGKQWTSSILPRRRTSIAVRPVSG